MVVFSTLDPNRIDLSRTSARAVADLKHFLEYAERGPSALGAAVHGSKGDFESPFELSVARALRAKGWEVHTQIGVSAYRVDLGIVHPDFPGRYIAGIECDGAMYHSSAFARERDKIRQSVLEGLGWTLFRIWSTDWWTHATMALDTVHQALSNCLKADRKKAADASAAAPPSHEESASLPLAEEESDSAEDAAPQKVDPKEARGLSERAMPSFQEQRLPPASPAAPNPFATADGRYVFVALDPVRHRPDIDQFYSEGYAKRLAAMIDHVIDTEGPIHEEMLVKRIALHHGFQRVRSQLREAVLAIARRRRGSTYEDDVGRFFWKKGTVRDRLAPARYEDRDEELRKLEFICREELKAIHTTLGLGDDPVEFARRLGVARLNQASRNRLAKIVR
jgi:very-short-patch-repair endonuclease